jgi:hypothetical protein
MKLLSQVLLVSASLGFLAATGCYSRTVKETSPPVVMTQPSAQTTTNTTTTSDNGEVVRHSTTTYSNP